MRKSDLIDRVADITDLPKNKAENVVSAILEEITNSLSRDDTVNWWALALSASAIGQPVLVAALRPVLP